MTRSGIAPQCFIITVSCGVLAGWLTSRYAAVFAMVDISAWILMTLGCVLVIAGAWLYSAALHVFNEGFQNKQLVTHGPYAVVRHPIYAAWILLICPGIALFFRSWLMLLLPLVAYSCFKLTIHHEEHFLEEQFGHKFRDYRSCTDQLFPTIDRFPK
jgi:protein-S-isoprenylcysteine O-methyltransferase Ste14